MNDKLKDFAEEMINEIKDLKDLTKENLPLIAKEYVEYNVITNLLGGVILALLSLGLCTLIAWCIISKDGKHPYDAIAFIAGAVTLLTTLFSTYHFSEVIAFKLQPRRKAILAITTLMKGRE